MDALENQAIKLVEHQSFPRPSASLNRALDLLTLSIGSDHLARIHCLPRNQAPEFPTEGVRCGKLGRGEEGKVKYRMTESLGSQLRARDRLSSVTMNPLKRFETTITGGIIAMAVSVVGATELFEIAALSSETS